MGPPGRECTRSQACSFKGALDLWAEADTPQGIGRTSSTSGLTRTGPHLCPLGGAGNRQEGISPDAKKAFRHRVAGGLQEWEGREMGPLLCCSRMPCLLAIPGVIGSRGAKRENQWKLKEKEASIEASGAAVPSEGSAEGGPIFKLTPMAAGRLHSICLGLRTPSVPCYASLSQEQLTTWELASFGVSKQERANQREGQASL